MANHFDNLQTFKEKIMALSFDKSFIELQNLSPEKLRQECINLVQYLDSFPAKSMANDQANIMGLTWDSIRYCIIKVVGSKYLTFEKKVGMCSIIPNGTYATIRVSYPAYVAALNEHDIVVTFDKVREDDSFEEVTENGRVKLYHKKAKFSDKPVIGYYALAVDKNGFAWCESMNLGEIEKRKKAAKTDFIWVNWIDEMSMKTPLLRLCNKYFRHFLTDLLSVDIDNEYKEVVEQLPIKRELPTVAAKELPTIKVKELPDYAESEPQVIKLTKEDIDSKLTELRTSFEAQPTEKNRDSIAAEIETLVGKERASKFLIFANSHIEKVLAAEVSAFNKLHDEL